MTTPDTPSRSRVGRDECLVPDGRPGTRGFKSRAFQMRPANENVHPGAEAGMDEALERATGFEPATTSLGSWDSTN